MNRGIVERDGDDIKIIGKGFTTQTGNNVEVDGQPTSLHPTRTMRRTIKNQGTRHVAGTNGSS
jgi:hypothetical protein